MRPPSSSATAACQAAPHWQQRGRGHNGANPTSGAPNRPKPSSPTPATSCIPKSSAPSARPNTSSWRSATRPTIPNGWPAKPNSPLKKGCASSPCCWTAPSWEPTWSSWAHERVPFVRNCVFSRGVSGTGRFRRKRRVWDLRPGAPHRTWRQSRRVQLSKTSSISSSSSPSVLAASGPGVFVEAATASRPPPSA